MQRSSLGHLIHLRLAQPVGPARHGPTGFGSKSWFCRCVTERSIAAADVADATATAARSATAPTDAGYGAAPAAGSATTSGASRDGSATAAGSATTSGASRDGAASPAGSATTGAWCCRWRHAGRRSGRWCCATAWPLIAAASNREHEHGGTAEKRGGSSGFGSHQIPHSPLAPHLSSPPVRTPACLSANRASKSIQPRVGGASIAQNSARRWIARTQRPSHTRLSS